MSLPDSTAGLAKGEEDVKDKKTMGWKTGNQGARWRRTRMINTYETLAQMAHPDLTQPVGEIDEWV